MGVADRLKSCRCLQDIRGFTFLACLFAVFHQAVTSGLIPAILSTLELRYGLTSVQSGALLSTYNVSKLIMSIPMSYVCGKGSIPRNMAICSFLVALGCALFSGAELLSSKYVPSGVGGSRDVCSPIPLPAGCSTPETSNLYYLLLIGQGLIALGASAPYCIAPAFITNNVEAKRSVPLLGLFFASSALGPALGFLGGGVLLGFWVDPSGLPPGFETLNSADKQWVGNWWLGVLFCGVALVALIPFLVAIPARLPDAPTPLEADEDDGKISLRDVSRLLVDILTNASWWLISLAVAFEAFAVSGYTGFGPKYIQTQFLIKASSASILAGGGVVPAAVVGAVVGGWWDGRKHDKLSQSAIFNTKMAAISTVLVIICVFIGCDTQPIVGFGSSPPYALNLDQGCNTNCNCDGTYAPVCGADGNAYFSACWAGCANSTKGDSSSYASCSCVFSNQVNQTAPSLLPTAVAVPGMCKSCTMELGLFMLFFFLFLLFTFMNHTPSSAILLRVVPSVKHKSLSLGLNDVVYKILGSIPGPLIFGATFDNNCILNSQSCEGSSGSCAVYDNYAVRLIMLLVLGGIFKSLSTICNLASVRAILKQEARRSISHRTSLVFPQDDHELDAVAAIDAALDVGQFSEAAGIHSRKSSMARLSSKGSLMAPLSPAAPEPLSRNPSGLARGSQRDSSLNGSNGGSMRGSMNPNNEDAVEVTSNASNQDELSS